MSCHGLFPNESRRSVHVAAQGSISLPMEEELTDAEMREAWFKVVEAAHRGQPRPGARVAALAPCWGHLHILVYRQAAGPCSNEVVGAALHACGRDPVVSNVPCRLPSPPFVGMCQVDQELGLHVSEGIIHL